MDLLSPFSFSLGCARGYECDLTEDQCLLTSFTLTNHLLRGFMRAGLLKMMTCCLQTVMRVNPNSKVAELKTKTNDSHTGIKVLLRFDEFASLGFQRALCEISEDVTGEGGCDIVSLRAVRRANKPNANVSCWLRKSAHVLLS